MANLPKTNTNFHPYLPIAITTGNTVALPPNTGTVALTSSGTVAAQTLTLPGNMSDGDEIYIVSQYAITALTVSAPTGSSILAGPAAPTTLAAGTQIGYLKIGNNFLRVQ